MGDLMEILRRLDAALADAQEARAEAERLRADHAALTAHCDRLERALETIAEAVDETWDRDDVEENTGRVVRAIERLKWRSK